MVSTLHWFLWYTNLSITYITPALFMSLKYNVTTLTIFNFIDPQIMSFHHYYMHAVICNRPACRPVVVLRPYSFHFTPFCYSIIDVIPKVPYFLLDLDLILSCMTYLPLYDFALRLLCISRSVHLGLFYLHVISKCLVTIPTLVAVKLTYQHAHGCEINIPTRTRL